MIYCTAGSVLLSSPCLWFSYVFFAFSFFSWVNLVWPMENCQKSVFWFIKGPQCYLFCCLYPTREQGPDTQMKQSDCSLFGAPSSTQSRKQAHEICTRRGHRCDVGGGGRSAYETQERGDAKIEAENEVKREEKHACWRLCLYGNDIHLPPYFMHQILRTICRILANITVHLWEPFISLIHWSTGDKRRTERLQRQKSQTAKPLRCEQVPISKINIISVWASRNLCAFVLTL